jgi:hypothetical protein
MGSERRPWFKLYAQSYLRDTDLMGVSWAAEGLHARLMSLSHLSELPGRLVQNHRPMDAKDIAAAKWGPRYTSDDLADVERLMQELCEAHRIERDEVRGCWYIPKMVKLYEEQKQAAKWGKHGGNPKLKGGENGKG